MLPTMRFEPEFQKSQHQMARVVHTRYPVSFNFEKTVHFEKTKLNL